MLEGDSLQSLVPGLTGGGERKVVAGIGLVVAAHGHEDLGAPAMTGGDFAMVAEPFVDGQRILGDCQGLVMLAGVSQRVGEVAHRGGEIPQFGRRFGVIRACQKRLPRLSAGAFHQLSPTGQRLPAGREWPWRKPRTRPARGPALTVVVAN